MPAGQWTTREQIAVAFWNLVAGTTGFVGKSRKFMHWDQVIGQAQMPYITMLRGGEERIRQSDGTPVLKIFYKVFLYTMIGDQKQIPDSLMNDLLQNLDVQVRATGSDIGENRQTLGGLVWTCYPLGHAFVDPGDLDGKSVAMVPFEILTPWLV